MNKENHWISTQEVISTNRPLKLTLFLIKMFPSFIVHALVFPVSFFFFLGAKKAKMHYKNFLKQMKEYTKGKFPKSMNSYFWILSFSFSIVEELEGWLGKIKYKNIIKHDDALPELISLLENGKGAFLIGSHLGNLDLLRSLSSFCETGVSKKISVTTVMNMTVTKELNNTLKEINSDFETNIIDSDSVGPEAIFAMQEEIQNGGLVIILGDRTSAHSERSIKHDFLGKTANFPYGVFLIATLLKAPVYFVFGIRDKNNAILSKSHIFVEKSKIDFANCTDREAKAKIPELCDEYVTTLEKYCIKYPYQWYNFFDFWQNSEGDNNG